MQISSLELIGYTAGLVSFLNMFRYMWAIQKNGTRPSIGYWILAEIAMILIATSSYALGDRTSLWIAVAYASTQIIIIGMAFRHGYIGLKKMDFFLFFLAGFSVLLWWYTDNPLYALLINVGIDASGYIPLFRTIWKHPEEEDLPYWCVAAGACVLNMFAVREISLEGVLYPWYLGIINSIVFLVLIRNPLLSYGKKILR